MSAWVGAEQYLDYFNRPDSDLQGGITASMSGGSFLGAIGAGFLADFFGRKIALQIACGVFVIGCAIVCSSQNVAQLIVGRFSMSLNSASVDENIANSSQSTVLPSVSVQVRFVSTWPSWLPVK